MLPSSIEFVLACRFDALALPAREASGRIHAYACIAANSSAEAARKQVSSGRRRGRQCDEARAGADERGMPPAMRANGGAATIAAGASGRCARRLARPCARRRAGPRARATRPRGPGRGPRAASRPRSARGPSGSARSRAPGGQSPTRTPTSPAFFSKATVRLSVVWSVNVVAPSRPKSTGSIARIAHKQRELARAKAHRTQLLVVDRRHHAGHHLEVVVGAFGVARDIGSQRCAARARLRFHGSAWPSALPARAPARAGHPAGAGAFGQRQVAGICSRTFRTDSIRGSWPRCSARSSRRFARMNAYACAARNILRKPVGRKPPPGRMRRRGC